jgi:hypothetical protein
MTDTGRKAVFSEERIRAGLNLVAVLQNLEELAAYDPESARIVAGWDITFRLRVLRGPHADLLFRNGRCRVGPGLAETPGVLLLFLSPGHCNRVFDGRLPPIPIRGGTRISVLKGFSRLTRRLKFFLGTPGTPISDPRRLALNTLMRIHTAAFAVQELAHTDSDAMRNAARIRDGTVVMKLGERPVVSVTFENGRAHTVKGGGATPMAEMSFRDVKAANAFLNGRSDVYAAVASGAVQLRGQIPMLRHMGLIFDRLPRYLAP